ncbi:hypothetical protein JXJ21_15730 [candidate division KSB1 bacterium]|nr:hypothetical protein [candidate division KSB1 bacterium]
MVTPTARDGLERCVADCQRVHLMKIWSLMEKHNQKDQKWADDAEELFFNSFNDSKAKQKWDELADKTQKGHDKYQKDVLNEISKFNRCLQTCRKQARKNEMEEELIKQIMGEKLKVEREKLEKAHNESKAKSEKQLNLKVPPKKKLP